jgi:hypothetical protein
MRRHRFSRDTVLPVGPITKIIMLSDLTGASVVF